jgi:hypothetical protein
MTSCHSFDNRRILAQLLAGPSRGLIGFLHCEAGGHCIASYPVVVNARAEIKNIDSRKPIRILNLRSGSPCRVSIELLFSMHGNRIGRVLCRLIVESARAGERLAHDWVAKLKGQNVGRLPNRPGLGDIERQRHQREKQNLHKSSR